MVNKSDFLKVINLQTKIKLRGCIGAKNGERKRQKICQMTAIFLSCQVWSNVIFWRQSEKTYQGSEFWLISTASKILLNTYLDFTHHNQSDHNTWNGSCRKLYSKLLDFFESLSFFFVYFMNLKLTRAQPRLNSNVLIFKMSQDRAKGPEQQSKHLSLL